MEIGKKPKKENLVELLPKQYRAKANALMHYIDGKVSLDENQRYVHDDGTVASHLIDLIRYYVTPTTIKLPRPLDAVEFGLLLKSIDVPDFAISGI